MEKTRLDQVAKVEISGVDKKTKPGQQIVRLCNFTDVYYNWAITQDLHDSFMVASASQKEIDSLSLHKGQVALTKDSETRDDIGVSAYIADDFDDVVLGYHTALITPDETKLNGKYLNAFLHTPYMQKYFAFNASGSGQRYTLSTEALNAIQLILPSPEEQERIGNLFSLLDRKISLNRSINKELEEMAKEIYDYWFVQFDFPDANGRPYKSSGGTMVYNPILKREIPEGWSDSIVKDCIEPLERGISYTSESIENPNGYPMINLACYTKQGDYRTGEMKYYTGEVKDRHKAYPYDMLIACTDMTQGADVIGRPVLATEESEWFVYSMDLAKITPVNIAKMYLYYTLRTSFYHKYIKPFASGTTVKHLNTQGVESYKIVVPTSDVQEKFENLITPIKHQQMLLINEILELEQQRNELIPLLMTGQVKIE